MNICVIGAGAWGTAMALHLTRKGHNVSLVARRVEHALDIATNHENKKYLAGYTLPLDMQIGCMLRPVLMEAEVVFLAIPSKTLTENCKNIRDHLQASKNLRLIITLCKGMTTTNNKRPSEIVSTILPDYSCATLSGPTFAEAVAAGKPSAAVLCGTGSEEELREAQEAISDNTFRIYFSKDLVGVELGGALKNVYAIASGICDGLALGDNAKAALLTRSLAEMVRLGSALRGQKETFYGLSGFGDLVATCNGSWSRNRIFGEKIAQGHSIENLLSEMVVEGYGSTKSFFTLSHKESIGTPILDEIYTVIYANKNPREAVEALMSRGLKEE